MKKKKEFHLSSTLIFSILALLTLTGITGLSANKNTSSSEIVSAGITNTSYTYETASHEPHTRETELNFSHKATSAQTQSRQRTNINSNSHIPPSALKPRQTTASIPGDSANLADLLPQGNELFVRVNNNVPVFDNENLSPVTYEQYSPLDDLGRVGSANAVLGLETMPTERRGDISEVHPSGWVQHEYKFIKGGVLYNRSHLIAYQLSAENANPLNLMTGTRQLNQSGMTTFEALIAEYIKTTGHHVRYRVTPHFKGTELVARGVQLEAKSVEDEKISFNVYIFNKQKGVEIDYLTGSSIANELPADKNSPASADAQAKIIGNKPADKSTVKTAEKSKNIKQTVANNENNSHGRIIGNSKTKIYHMPYQKKYKIADKNIIYFDSEEEAIAAGYRKSEK